MTGSTTTVRSNPSRTQVRPREPEPAQAPARPLAVNAVLALQRSAGNAAVASLLRRPAPRVLARELPKSTQGWSQPLETTDKNSAAAWCEVLASLDDDSGRTYIVKDGAVVVSDNVKLHPRKLQDLLAAGLLTRVLSWIPTEKIKSVEALEKTPALKVLKGGQYKLRFLVQDEGKVPDFSKANVQASAKALDMERAVEYATWLGEKDHITSKTNSQLANHAQFFLSDATAGTEGDKTDPIFTAVWAEYQRIHQASGASLPGPKATHFPIAAEAADNDVVATIQASADQLKFASDSTALYHAAKHPDIASAAAAPVDYAPGAAVKPAIRSSARDITKASVIEQLRICVQRAGARPPGAG